MKLFWGLLLAPLVVSGSSSNSCVKTDNYSQLQCRGLKTRDQQQTMGRICISAGESPETLKITFDSNSAEWTLDWARLWIGPPELMESMESTAFATMATRGEDGHQETEALEIIFENDAPILTCPSCDDLELQVLATASASNKNKQGESLTLYGFEQKPSSLLSHVFGKQWMETTAVEEPLPFEGFSIHMTCDCEKPTTSGLARLLRRRL